MFGLYRLIGLSIMLLCTQFAGAAVKSKSADQYHLMHTAESNLSAEDLWQRLLRPQDWWDDSHTYSGNADNLSLQPVAGGHWLEKWGENSVVHGQVMLVLDGKQLRLTAPFGPLQGLGVSVVWTITIEPQGEGSIVTFEEIASGTPASD
ncbi:MAG: hypothetical protein AAF197_01125 [Pseudomonadota bacterium]